MVHLGKFALAADELGNLMPRRPPPTRQRAELRHIGRAVNSGERGGRSRGARLRVRRPNQGLRSGEILNTDFSAAIAAEFR